MQKSPNKDLAEQTQPPFLITVTWNWNWQLKIPLTRQNSLFNKNKLKSETSADILSTFGSGTFMFDPNEMKPESTVDTHSPFHNEAIYGKSKWKKKLEGFF